MISMLLLAASAPMASQAEPAKPSLPASSKWTVEYADNSCNIGKTFGAADREVKLWMKILPGRANTQLLIEEKRPGGPVFRTGDLIITPASGKPVTVTARHGSVNRGTRLILGNLGFADLEALESSRSLTFAYRREAFALTDVNLRSALAAARSCEDDLLTSWGVDPVEYRKIATHAQPSENPSGWLSYSNLHRDDLTAGKSGRIIVRLDVAATGQLTGCAIVAPSLVPSIDEITCPGLMKRARFTAARTGDGNAVSSIAFLSFRWETWGSWY